LRGIGHLLFACWPSSGKAQVTGLRLLNETLKASQSPADAPVGRAGSVALSGPF